MQVEAVIIAVMGLRRVKKSNGIAGALADVLVSWEDGTTSFESYARMMRQIPHMLQDFKNSRTALQRSRIFDVEKDCEPLVKALLEEEKAILEKAKIASEEKAKSASEEKEASDGDETASKTKE
jgi:hypothetical protein